MPVKTISKKTRYRWHEDSAEARDCYYIDTTTSKVVCKIEFFAPFYEATQDVDRNHQPRLGSFIAKDQAKFYVELYIKWLASKPRQLGSNSA